MRDSSHSQAQQSIHTGCGIEGGRGLQVRLLCCKSSISSHCHVSLCVLQIAMGSRKSQLSFQKHSTATRKAAVYFL